MSIKIRQATVDDSPFLAQMILQSSRAGKKDGIFDLLFQLKNEKKILSKLEALVQTESRSHCHYKNFLLAEVDGKSVGTLCSYEPRISTKETFLKALTEIGCEKTRDHFVQTLEVFYGCEFELNKRTLMFDFMEELEGFIDVGVLKALMQKSLLTARLKGYTIAQTILEIGSLENELFYKKMGFSVIKEQKCELYKEKFGRNGLKLLSMQF